MTTSKPMVSFLILIKSRVSKIERFLFFLRLQRGKMSVTSKISRDTEIVTHIGAILCFSDS